MVAKEEGLRQVAAEKAVWGDEGQDDQAVRSQDEKCLCTWRGCASLFQAGWVARARTQGAGSGGACTCERCAVMERAAPLREASWDTLVIGAICGVWRDN